MRLLCSYDPSSAHVCIDEASSALVVISKDGVGLAELFPDQQMVGYIPVDPPSMYVDGIPMPERSTAGGFMGGIFSSSVPSFSEEVNEMCESVVHACHDRLI